MPAGNCWVNMKAIPFHSSVRIKLSSGKAIKDGADDVIGINVIAKTIKNKVAPPFRKVNFEIHFGKGIVEHEQLFDALRVHCGKEGIDIGNYNMRVHGTGSWKYFDVTDIKTGEMIAEHKYYKKDFGKLLQNPAVSEYLEQLMENYFVKKLRDPDEIDIDTDSFAEVQAVADELGSDFVDPEAS